MSMIDDRAEALADMYGPGSTVDNSRKWALDLIALRHPTAPLPDSTMDAWAELIALDGYSVNMTGWLQNEVGSADVNRVDLWAEYWASHAQNEGASMLTNTQIAELKAADIAAAKKNRKGSPLDGVYVPAHKPAGGGAGNERGAYRTVRR